MTWFKVDDGFWGHPKQTALPSGPIALWVRAGSWSGAQLTDGFVPAHMVAMLGGKKRDAEQLVTAGLWDEVDGGYQFHDWDEFQPTREQVLKDRADARKRMSKRRKPGSGSGDVRANNDRTSGDVRLPRPVPTRPDQSQSVEGGSHVSSDAAEQPPLYPDHCRKHARVGTPGACGDCKDQREANKVLGLRHLSPVPAPTRRCIVHDTSFERVCNGCEADRKAAESA